MEPEGAAAGELCVLLPPPPKMEDPPAAPPPNSEGLPALLPPPKMDPPLATEPKPEGLRAAACPKMLPPEVAPVAAREAAELPNGNGLLVAAAAKRPVGGAAGLVANTLASGLGTLPKILPVGG